MTNVDLEQINGENTNPQNFKNSEDIKNAQNSFQARVLLGTLGLLQYTKELLGILPEKRHPSEIVEMLAKKRQEALSTLGDEAANDDVFDEKKVA